jgi:phosphatidylinositol-3-phosphatase
MRIAPSSRCARLRLMLLVTALALLCLAGCGGSHSSRAVATPTGRSGPCGRTGPPQSWKHVIWIWMENRSYGQVIGSRSAPTINRLARQCGLATGYKGVTHPSLPNYIAATSGGTWGITDDASPAEHTVSRESIFGQLAARGRTWRSYEESMPARCGLTNAGLYAVKHNPAAYYLRSRDDCRRWDVPLEPALAHDLRDDRLPAFAFVTPNLCNDMHDCSVATGDAWLQRWVPRILASRAYRSASTVLVITFDEGEDSSNRVPTIVVSPSTQPGTQSDAPFDHYSLLKTTEELLGLPPLARAGAPATASMRTAFHLG